MVLNHPVTNKPIKNPETKKSVSFSIVNQDSKTFNDAQSAAQAKLQTIYEETKEVPSADKIREVTYEMMASLVIGWTEDMAAFLKDELGDNCAYSSENAYKILSNPDYYWIVKQIDAFVADKTRFFKKQ